MMFRKFLNKNLYPILLLLLVGIFFNALFLSPEKVLSSPDILASAYFPKFFFSSFFNLSHQIPLWNPYMFSGTPFLANPSSGIFYPINIIFLLLPTSFAFDYLFILDIFLIGLFTYLFARKINLDNFSSFISAIVFMFSGTIIYRVYPGHLYILDAIVWLPIILFFYERIFEKRNYVSGAIAGIAISLMIFVGHSQFTFYNLMFSSLYFLLRLFFDLKETKNLIKTLKLFFIFTLSIITALGISAIQLIPSLELSNLSERSGGISFDFATAFSLPIYQVASFILPNFFGSPFNTTYWGKGNIWELGGYLGLAPLLFSTLAVFLKRNKYVTIFLAFSILALLLSFGNYGPLYNFFYNYVPFFNLFRAPARFLYIYAFSVSILCGLGLNYILSNNFKKKIYLIKKLFLLGFTTSIFTTIISLFFYLSPNLSLYEKYVLRNSFAVGINHQVIFNQTIIDLFFFGVFSFIIFLSILLHIFKKIKVRIFMIFIFTITIAQLWIFDYKVVNLISLDKLLETPKVVQQINKDKSIYRVFSKTGDYNPILMINGHQVLTGYEGEYLRNYRDFLWLMGPHAETPFESFIVINSINNPVILSLLNTKYVIWDEELNSNNLKLIQKYKNNLFLYENLYNFPRAYLVLDNIVKERKFIISDNQSNTFKLKSLKNYSFLTFEKSDIYKNINVDNYSPDKISLNVTNEKPAYLILSEIWYPGWKAYDNGREIKIQIADYIFRTIHLEKGSHKIIFTFESGSFKTGRNISLLSIIVIALIVIFGRIKNKK